MEGFEPRITIRDDDDAELIFAAVLDFQIKMASLSIVMGHVDMTCVQAAKRAGEIAVAIGEDMQSAAIRKLAEVPDDISGLDDGTAN